jgi:hypothetical protein
MVDSLPIPVCDNIRIRRSRLYEGEQFRGYIASKKRYFYGLRLHMIVTAEDGAPVEFFLEAGAANDNSEPSRASIWICPLEASFTPTSTTTTITTRIC